MSSDEDVVNEMMFDECNSNTIGNKALLKYVSKKVQLLAFGYMRNTAFKEYHLDIPSSIIAFIMLYTYPKLQHMKWSYTASGYAEIYRGKRLKCISNGGKWIAASSHVSWKKSGKCSKHRFKVKLVKRPSAYKAAEQIGVITDYRGTTKANMNLNKLGYNLYYYSYNRTIYHNGNEIEKVNVEWKEGDVMALALDYTKWTLSFVLNKCVLGTFDLTPNRTYYPALSMMAREKYEFKLLSA
eukprot:533460_1